MSSFYGRYDLVVAQEWREQSGQCDTVIISPFGAASQTCQPLTEMTVREMTHEVEL